MSCNGNHIIISSKLCQNFINLELTVGSNSPPTKAFTPPSFNDTLLIVELSLSATNIRPSVWDKVSPDGWANPAFVG